MLEETTICPAGDWFWIRIHLANPARLPSARLKLSRRNIGGNVEKCHGVEKAVQAPLTFAATLQEYNVFPVSPDTCREAVVRVESLTTSDENAVSVASWNW